MGKKVTMINMFFWFLLSQYQNPDYKQITLYLRVFRPYNYIIVGEKHILNAFSIITYFYPNI